MAGVIVKRRVKAKKSASAKKRVSKSGSRRPSKVRPVKAKPVKARATKASNPVAKKAKKSRAKMPVGKFVCSRCWSGNLSAASLGFCSYVHCNDCGLREAYPGGVPTNGKAKKNGRK